jgi:hypothetical protein
MITSDRRHRRLLWTLILSVGGEPTVPRWKTASVRRARRTAVPSIVPASPPSHAIGA